MPAITKERLRDKHKERLSRWHTGLAGNTSGDDNNISTLEGGTELLGTRETLDAGGSVNVAQVDSDTWMQMIYKKNSKVENAKMDSNPWRAC